MRLIDADALIEIVEDGLRNNPHEDGYARACHRTEYTHFLDVIRWMPTIAPQPNDPLTLEELREMDGEPVFFASRDGERRWGIISVYHGDSGGCGVEVFFTEFQRMDCWNYGYDGWLAYRRRPEEG